MNGRGTLAGPIEAERTCGMDSVRTRRPLGRTDRRMLRVGDGVAVGVGVRVADMLYLLWHTRIGYWRAAKRWTGLVLSGHLDMIDNKRVDRAFGGNEFQAQLFLDCGEDGWGVRIGMFVGGPGHLKVEIPGEASVVDDGTMDLAGQGLSE